MLAEDGAARLLAGGNPEGLAGGLSEGAAGGATLAALPAPLGSFSELFNPPALPGPRGMPLTPASCAKACGAHIKLVTMIKASNRNLTLIHFSPSRLLTAADCCWFRGPGLVVCLATNYRTSEFIMCNLLSDCGCWHKGSARYRQPARLALVYEVDVHSRLTIVVRRSGAAIY